MKISNTIAIVSGGSKGLGKATARLLVEKGATVIITARNKDELEQTAHEIGAVAFDMDVADEQQVRALFEWVQKEYGRLDVLINNAGLIRGRNTINETALEDFEYVYRINVFGAAMMAKYASRIFMEQKSGNIVNIASTAALKGYKGGSIYASSKFALRGMTQCWQDELRPYNVRVFGVNPTYVPTAFGTESGIEKPVENNKVAPVDIAHAIVSSLEMDDRAFIPELTVWATNPW
jgi:3-oxoacyl-[acyl-carrier protein] reductase